MANTDNGSGVRPKEHLIKSFTERRDHFEKLIARTAKLDLKLEPVPETVASHGSEEEFAARYEAVKEAKRRNAARQRQYDLEYDSLLQQLEESPSLTSPQAPNCNSEYPPRAQERSEENELQPSTPAKDVNSDNNPILEAPNQRLSEIQFNEVYKSGQANPKDFIVEYPTNSDTFYILRCVMCKPAPFSYESNFRAAGRHLDIEAHGFLKRSAENAVKHLGIRVLGCTTDLATKNNEAYKKWFDSPEVQQARKRQSFHKPTSAKKPVAQEKPHGRKRSLHDTVFDEDLIPAYAPAVSKRRRVTHLEPSNIKAGNVYCLNQDKAVYQGVIVILPLFEDWPDWKTEVLQTPEMLGFWSEGIHKPPPDHFETDPATNVPTDWACDFRPNGARVQQRRYPAVFIEGEQWQVSHTSIGWAALSDIAPYEEALLHNSVRKGAKDYLRQRDAAQRRHEGIETNDQRHDSSSLSQREQVDVDPADNEQSDGSDKMPVEELRPSTQRQSNLNGHASPHQNSKTAQAEAESQAHVASSGLSLVVPNNDAVPEKHSGSTAVSDLRIALLTSSHAAAKHEHTGHKETTQPLLSSRNPNDTRRAGKRSFGTIPNTSSVALERRPAKFEQVSDSSDDEDDGNEDIANEPSPIPRIQSDIRSDRQPPLSNGFRSPYIGKF